MSKIAVNEITDEQGSGRPSFTNGVQTSNINGGQVGGRRNLIINGAMQVAQRGTSVTGSTAPVSYLCVDRWQTHNSGGVYNVSQQEVSLGGEAGLPDQFRYYQRFEATTADNNMGFFYHIEDVKSVQGTFTLSFYAKGTNPAGGELQFQHRQQTSSFGHTNETKTNFSITSNWERYTFTFTTGSLDGLSIDDATSSYRLAIVQPTEDSSTDPWTLDITGVQLEVGDTATEFEHRSYGEELALCQRYYQQFQQSEDVYVASAGSSGFAVSQKIFFTNLMRTSPTITLSPAGNSTGQSAFIQPDRGYVGTVGTNEAGRISPEGFNITAGTYASTEWIAGAAITFYATGLQTIWSADAEL